MQKTRAALSPENLHLLSTVARCGSMAAAARELGLVPSALTYRVRQMEDALDVLLFDRHSRRARPTPAGAELLRSGEHLLGEWEALAQQVRRIATGWEPQLTISADAIIARGPLLELCEAFFALGAPTQLRLRTETLSGTLETLSTGQADLALGITMESALAPGLQADTLGEVAFVFVVAPHHPLAQGTEPLSPADVQQHRAVAVADSTQRGGGGLTFGLLPGQPVFTVPTMQHKLEAQLRGLGCGSLPQPLVQPYLDTGRLVARRTTMPTRLYRPGYAWRGPASSRTRSTSGQVGSALQWWLDRLASPATRQALLHHHAR